MNFFGQGDNESLSENNAALVHLGVEFLGGLGKGVFTQSETQEVESDDDSVQSGGLSVTGVFQGGENFVKEHPFNEFFIIEEKFGFSGQIIDHLVEQESIIGADAL